MNFQNFSINYDKTNNIVVRKINSKYLVLDDPEKLKESIIYIHNLLIKNNCHKLLSDFSLTGIHINYDAEFNYAKNFKKIFNYPEGTFIAMFEGEFYSDKKWDLFRKVLKDINVTNIEFFGDYEAALEWLINK